ncbi:MAG TPA: tRNA preQ1(34) S-adenosylmethionine ribosyltransferase-isomerase QueA [Steroidobacteraceae bacterium]|nr:tRNA preQ1(34) S-adenosylmethionine ribosyltransferase-isomerase QueA [Steroidobacteraceae bacterium]
MRRQDFSYHLPPELIAQTPLAERSASRMLVLAGAGGALVDAAVRELPAYLAPGDLVVFNDTRVVAARLAGSKPTGGQVEILLERALAGNEALAQISASKPVREGLSIATAGGEVRVLERRAELWRIALPADALDFFERWGAVPLPPYIDREPEPADRERYQSVFARERGAVAAPTASLHFDAALLAALEARGVECAFVTLHVGAGTFQPVRVDDLAAHSMHAERATVSRAACEAVARTRARGGRVVAVGTTVMRALEAAALAAANGARAASDVGTARAPALPDGRTAPALSSWSGETRLFITPGFRFQVCDALLTNFHLPESTLLMLVCAFAGREAVLGAYRHAIAARYRFFSYGDAMLLTARGT